MAQTQYFLGGNTAHGFVSFYDGFCCGERDFLWILKGGPGCGKSSFMRTIADAAVRAGLSVEYVLCSADPSSLDGVYIPAWHTGYVDGTAPHIIEPSVPGAAGLYVDLGQFYDRAALLPKRAAIEQLQARSRACYREAYACLRALAPQPQPLPPGKRTRRFLRALTSQGLICAQPWHSAAVQPDLSALCARPDAVLYQHPLFPGQTEAVFLPGQNTLCRLPDEALPELTQPTALLAEARALHDELETLYNPHVDFPRVYALANSHVFRLLREN